MAICFYGSNDHINFCLMFTSEFFMVARQFIYKFKLLLFDI